MSTLRFEGFAALKGKTLKSVSGGEKGSDEINFLCEDGTAFRLYHEQGCCERVCVEDVAGEWEDLIGRPLLVAEEVSSFPDFTDPHSDSEGRSTIGSHTWTFYRLGTERGFVILRWLGTSNGYCSESVSFAQVK
jgi:hypothetical protein